MPIPKFVPGYVYDPVRAAEVKQFRQERGDKVMASEQNALPGTWARMKAEGVTCLLLRDAELMLVGKYRRPYLQRRGTCTSRGFARGVQTALDHAIAKLGVMLEPKTVTFAPIYTLARVECGKNRCGYADGACLFDAALAVHDYGVASIELFGDMSEDEIELLACKYADPRQRTPDSWKAACKGNVCPTFAPDSLSLVFDCIAAGYPVPYGSNWITGQPNKNGLSRLGDYGPHCRCLTGIATDPNGNDQLISSESWGRFPAGEPQDIDQTMDVDQIPCITIQTAGGPRRLAPGDVAVDAKQYWSAIQQTGEVWAVGAPSFNPAEFADLTTVQMPA